MLTRTEAVLFGILGGALVLTLGLLTGADRRGPSGTDGMAGIEGPAGLPGAAGPPGLAGADGVNGMDGVAGQQGAAGPQGGAGPQGAQGPAGIAGAEGAPGPAGAAGPEGATGAGDLGSGAVILVRQATACPPGWTAGGEVRLLTSPGYAMSPDQTESNAGVLSTATLDWSNVNFFLCARVAQ